MYFDQGEGGPARSRGLGRGPRCAARAVERLLTGRWRGLLARSSAHLEEVDAGGGSAAGRRSRRRCRTRTWLRHAAVRPRRHATNGQRAWRDTRVLRCPCVVVCVLCRVTRAVRIHFISHSPRVRERVTEAWVPTRRRFCETDDNERYPLMSNSRTRLVLMACVACGTVLSTAARGAVTASAATPLTIARAAERS